MRINIVLGLLAGAACLCALPLHAQAPGPRPFGPPGPGGGLGKPGMNFGKPKPVDAHAAGRKWLDVAYANQSPKEKLDIYLPKSGAGPFPVIVAVHGGGFDGGDKNSGEVNGEMAGLTRGYAVVPVNYRLSGEAIFPAAVYDVKAAIRFLRANAAKYHIDPDRVVIWGDSAGSNIASTAATSAAAGKLEDKSLGNPAQDDRVKVAIDWFGPTDFATMDELHAKAGIKSFMTHSDASSSESHYLGGALASVPDKVKAADPTTYISASTPPFFVENGDLDPIVPAQQDADFAAALSRAIGPDNVVHVVLKGSGHGGPAFETKENLDKVYSFIALKLK